MLSNEIEMKIKSVDGPRERWVQRIQIIVKQTE